MTVDVTTTQNPVTVNVNDTNVSVSVTDNVTTATVSGGTGPQGPTGPQGDPASLTPATSTAIGGIIVGSGLSVTVNGTLSATGAVSSVAGRTGAVTLTTADVSGYTAPPVTSVAGRTGTVTLSTSDISGLGTLATQSGTFSGTSSGTNTGDQTISLTGDVTGSGTGSFAATLAASGATAGTYTSVTVDTKGRVTSGTNPAGYSLPTATASVLGGIKIGSGLSIDGDGVVSSSSSYTLPNATTSTLGGVIVGTGLSVSSGTLSANVTSVAGRTGAVTIASSDVSGLATVATSGSAADLTGTLADARLSSAVALANNIIGAFQGYDAANSFYYIETMPRIAAFTGNSQGSGGINFVYFTPIKTVTVSSITFIGTTASTGLTLCRFGLYTFDGTSVTLVASTTSETTSTIFTTANTAYKRSFTSGATYTLAAGSRYAVACIQVGTTPASLLACSVGVAIAATTLPRLMSFVSSGLTDLPSSRNTSGDSSSAAVNYARLV